MNKEFISAINQVCHERQLSREIVIEAIEAALISAYKRNFGAAQTITAKIDPETSVHLSSCESTSKATLSCVCGISTVSSISNTTGVSFSPSIV